MYQAGFEIPASWQFISGALAVEQASIHDLTKWWIVALSMTVAVVLAGATSTIIQLARQESYKIVISVCGVLTAALTTINGVAFPLSPKEMSERINRAKSEFRSVILYIQTHELPAGGAERIDQLDRVNRLLANVERILNSGSASTAVPVNTTSIGAGWMGGVAYAANGDTFAEQRERSDDYLYFVGKGAADSLASARADSIRLAKQEAQRALLDQLPASPDSSKIAEVVASSGGVADTSYTSSDVGGKTIYEYRALYAIRKRNVGFYLSSAGVDLERVLGKLQKETAYYEKRWAASAAALDLARNRLSESDYRALVAGRDARRSQDYERCVKLLQPVIKENEAPWYLGWFNLGLSYWNLHRPEDATKAFSQALALEPQLQLRDPSVYNSYGQFLVERGDYAGGARLLRRALEIDPQIAGATYALRVAKRRQESGAGEALAAETVN